MGGGGRGGPLIRSIFWPKNLLGGLFANWVEYGKYNMYITIMKTILTNKYKIKATFLYTCYAR